MTRTLPARPGSKKELPMNGVERLLHRSIEVKLAFLADGGAKVIEKMADTVLAALRNGGRVYLCGNGGSAADIQHIAGEFVGRFMKERAPLSAVALSTDTSVMTSIANDYSYDTIFERQVNAHVRQGDVLIALSTSGNSPNVLRAVEAAKKLGAVTLGFSGRGGGKLKALADQCLVAPADESARIQELHITAGHILCDLVESRYFA
jgi:D-sedoheptulose 7-phosphate isomerase